MSNARRDGNNIAAIQGVDNILFQTPTDIAVNPVTHALLIDGPSLYTGLDTRYLKLDQTNEGSFVPVSLGDILYSDSSNHLTNLVGNKTTNQKFLSQTGTGLVSAAPSWQTIPSQGNLVYYLQSAASDVATYDKALTAPQVSKVALNFTLVNTTRVLQNFITDPGFPNLSFIPAGQYGFHIHVDSTNPASGAVYAEFWETNSVGADIALIGTSETTDTDGGLSGTEREYRLYFVNPNVYNLASTASRICCRVWFRRDSSSHTVNLYVGGEADSHVVLPSNTVDATNFVPYLGAITDVNLGAHSLTVGGSLTVQPTVDTLTALVVNDKDANNVLTVDTINNRVGIGITAPTAKLHIVSATTTNIIAETTTLTEGAMVQVKSPNSNWAFYTGFNDTNFSIYDALNTKFPFGVEANSPDNTFYINSSGQLIIGSTSSKLPIGSNTISVYGSLGISSAVNAKNDGYFASIKSNYAEEGFDLYYNTTKLLYTKEYNAPAYLRTDLGFVIDGSADRKQLIVQGHSTQTANLQEWQNSSGTPLAQISSTGAITGSNLSGTNTGDQTVREVLTANRTYYVRIDGSDSNTGTVNSAGGAFRSIQKAVDTAASIDISIYDVTINVGANLAAKTSTRFRSANVATIVTGTNHGFNNGDVVIIQGLGGVATYNSYAATVTVVNSTTFTYASTGADETPATGDTDGYCYLKNNKYDRVILKTTVGAGTVSILGNTTTPENVFIFNGGGATTGCITADNYLGKYFTSGFALGASPGAAFYESTSTLNILGGRFTIFNCSTDIIRCFGTLGYVYADSSVFTVRSRAGQSIIRAGAHHYVSVPGCTWNFTVPITLSGYFANISNLASVSITSNTYTNPGNVTGTQYTVSLNAVLNSGATLPGTIAGSTATQGIYI